MNRMTFQDGDVKYVRVSKAGARNVWAANETVVLCPVKLRPFGGWRPSITMHPDSPVRAREFDAVVREFEHYNCVNSETGDYAAFYVEVAP